MIGDSDYHKIRGEFRFPVFTATPNVSVQIISSTAAAPMQVYALRIEEILGVSGAVETQIVVEAETIFDVPANGIYYAPRLGERLHDNISPNQL
jgi:hypothetical protein